MEWTCEDRKGQMERVGMGWMGMEDGGWHEKRRRDDHTCRENIGKKGEKGEIVLGQDKGWQERNFAKKGTSREERREGDGRRDKKDREGMYCMYCIAVDTKWGESGARVAE